MEVVEVVEVLADMLMATPVPKVKLSQGQLRKKMEPLRKVIMAPIGLISPSQLQQSSMLMSPGR